MASRLEDFVTRLETANNDLIATVEGCSDEQWRQLCEDEGRSIGVVAFHVTDTHAAFVRMLGALADGKSYSPNISMEEIHQGNARQAREHADVGKPEVLDDLRQNGTALIQTLQRLNDGQLDQIAGVFGGNELTVAQVIEFVVIGHTQEHLDSIRAAIPA